jgi:hypothetical protein
MSWLSPPIPDEFEDAVDRMIYARGRADAWRKCVYIVGFEVFIILAVIVTNAFRHC